MYGIDSYEDLLYALFEYGADAIIVEDEETAKDCFNVFCNSSIKVEHIGNDIDADMLAKLDLSDANNVKRIITFVNGSAGSIRLPQDFDI